MMSREVMTGVVAALPAGRALQLMAYSWRALSRLLYEKCLLLTMPLRDRLVHELEVLAHDFGQSDPEGLVIDLPLTQADLAELVVGSRAKVSRRVTDLRRAGKLEVSGRRLILTRRFARHSECALGHTGRASPCVVRHDAAFPTPRAAWYMMSH